MIVNHVLILKRAVEILDLSFTIKYDIKFSASLQSAENNQTMTHFFNSQSFSVDHAMCPDTRWIFYLTSACKIWNLTDFVPSIILYS